MTRGVKSSFDQVGDLSLREVSGGHSDKRCEEIDQAGHGLIPYCGKVMVTD